MFTVNGCDLQIFVRFEFESLTNVVASEYLKDGRAVWSITKLRCHCAFNRIGGGMIKAW